MIQTEYILAIESSCDDTSVAIVSLDYNVVRQVTSSQPEHCAFGGVLPELASRLHMKNIMFLMESVFEGTGITLSSISAIAVSINPGLIGSLIVGLSFAKSLAWSLQIPLITVNHMLGHVYANHIDHNYIAPPYLALVVSGGHTELIHFLSDEKFILVGKTLDDAAGETFDKVAKLLGLGYPGGPFIDKLALEGNADFVIFPRALKQRDNFDFSYSGMKTAVLQFLYKQSRQWIEDHKADLAASAQQAIVDPLVNKTLRYARLHEIKTILLAGGVAANTQLRKIFGDQASRQGIRLYYPSLSLCMDNAAMIAAAAIPKYKARQFSPLEVNAFSLKGTRAI